MAFFPYLCSMNEQKQDNIQLSENFIIADADYLGKVAFNLTVNFERMLGRKIPRADMAQWAVDITLDGGLRPDGQQHETQLMLLYNENRPLMDCFQPADLKTGLNGQAFKDERLGEYIINAYATGKLVDKDEYLLQTLLTLTEHEEVRRVMIICNTEEGDVLDRVREVLGRSHNDSQRVTVFAMGNIAGGNYRTENLGFSLTDALGVRSEEFNK